MASRSGFTLVELSIVLIVIGLTIGAILVGRDLIEAARVRQQISQIEQFKVGVSTFRNKYGGIPGDLRADKAEGFGMAARSGTPGNGNGDGSIGACAPFNTDYFGCETVLFWNDLSFAGLIPGSFTMPSTGTTITVVAKDIGKYLPQGAISNQMSITALSLSPAWFEYANLPMCNRSFCLSLLHVFVIIDISGVVSGGPGAHVGVTPLQAYAIDRKMDDGKPLTGIVAGGFPLYTIVVTDPDWYGDPINHQCLSMAGTGASPDDFSYAVSGQYANQPECAMTFGGL